MGKASRIQSSLIGSALVCVRRNVQHRELKLSLSTRFALITAVMVAVPTGGPTGCLVSPPPLFSQDIQYYTIQYYTILLSPKIPYKP